MILFHGDIHPPSKIIGLFISMILIQVHMLLTLFVIAIRSFEAHRVLVQIGTHSWG